MLIKVGDPVFLCFQYASYAGHRLQENTNPCVLSKALSSLGLLNICSVLCPILLLTSALSSFGYTSSKSRYGRNDDPKVLLLTWLKLN